MAQFAFYYGMMPDPMAAHFGFSGEADSWVSRDGFFIFSLAIIFGTILIFLGIPRLFRKLKIKKYLNLPNKEYWTSPERIDFFYDYFEHSFQWFGVANIVLMVCVMQLTFEANLRPEPVLDGKGFLIVFSGYMAFVIIWVILFFLKFRKAD
jgi:uncharacterized membrane protein